jgi:hypothetical protein
MREQRLSLIIDRSGAAGDQEGISKGFFSEIDPDSSIFRRMKTPEQPKSVFVASRERTSRTIAGRLF